MCVCCLAKRIVLCAPQRAPAGSTRVATLTDAHTSRASQHICECNAACAVQSRRCIYSSGGTSSVPARSPPPGGAASGPAPPVASGARRASIGRTPSPSHSTHVRSIIMWLYTCRVAPLPPQARQIRRRSTTEPGAPRTAVAAVTGNATLPVENAGGTAASPTAAGTPDWSCATVLIAAYFARKRDSSASDTIPPPSAPGVDIAARHVISDRDHVHSVRRHVALRCESISLSCRAPL